jgi:hypothetical protein
MRHTQVRATSLLALGIAAAGLLAATGCAVSPVQERPRQVKQAASCDTCPDQGGGGDGTGGGGDGPGGDGPGGDGPGDPGGDDPGGDGPDGPEWPTDVGDPDGTNDSGGDFFECQGTNQCTWLLSDEDLRRFTVFVTSCASPDVAGCIDQCIDVGGDGDRCGNNCYDSWHWTCSNSLTAR